MFIRFYHTPQRYIPQVFPEGWTREEVEAYPLNEDYAQYTCSVHDVPDYGNNGTHALQYYVDDKGTLQADQDWTVVVKDYGLLVQEWKAQAKDALKAAVEKKDSEAFFAAQSDLMKISELPRAWEGESHEVYTWALAQLDQRLSDGKSDKVEIRTKLQDKIAALTPQPVGESAAVK